MRYGYEGNPPEWDYNYEKRAEAELEQEQQQQQQQPTNHGGNMKEIYLAMDRDGVVFGYNKMPVLGEFAGKWKSVTPNRDTWYSPVEIAHYFGIDVTKFPIKHETPIKIRAKWEVINE